MTETVAAYDLGAEEYSQRFASVDFQRYLMTFLNELPARSVVLDAGCGPGRDLARLSNLGRAVVGLDLSSGMISCARRAAPRAQLANGDVRFLPFAGSTFGGVWHCASLVHLSPPDVTRAVTEARRVLLPNGVLFLSVASGEGAEWRPAGNGRRWFHYYRLSQLIRIVEQAGLVVLSAAEEPGIAHGKWINIFSRKSA